jgi:hypothetical protein
MIKYGGGLRATKSASGKSSRRLPLKNILPFYRNARSLCGFQRFYEFDVQTFGLGGSLIGDMSCLISGFCRLNRSLIVTGEGVDLHFVTRILHHASHGPARWCQLKPGKSIKHPRHSRTASTSWGDIADPDARGMNHARIWYRG